MLTNMQAREARPRPTRYEVTCDVLPGFILRVHPAGKKVFYARSRNAAGKDRRHRIGRMVPGFGADDARREAQVILALRHAEARAGAPVRGARPPAKPYTRPTDLESPTLRELARRFEHEHISVKLQPASAAKYRSTLRLHILPPLGDRRLVDITTAAVQRLHDDLKATPSTANYVRSVLNVMYARAEQWELTTFNPVTAIRRLTERAPTRVISPEERQRLDRVLTSAEHIASDIPGTSAARRSGPCACWRSRVCSSTRSGTSDGSRSTGGGPCCACPTPKRMTSSSPTRSSICSARSPQRRASPGEASSSAPGGQASLQPVAQLGRARALAGLPDLRLQEPAPRRRSCSFRSHNARREHSCPGDMRISNCDAGRRSGGKGCERPPLRRRHRATRA